MKSVSEFEALHSTTLHPMHCTSTTLSPLHCTQSNVTTLLHGISLHYTPTTPLRCSHYTLPSTMQPHYSTVFHCSASTTMHAHYSTALHPHYSTALHPHYSTALYCTVLTTLHPWASLGGDRDTCPRTYKR